MPRLTIDGQTVNVDDSFTRMSPEQQNAAVEEIAKSLPAKRTGTIGETVDAAVRGAANALTFGFADRLAAGAGAATGIGGKQGDYEGNLAQQRAIDAANMKEHPVATIGGEVAGALAAPGAAFMRGPTLASRMARGAGVGAAQGAAYGVGSSPDLTNIPEVAGNAAVGLGTGALVGGVAPPVVESALAGGKALLNRSGIPQAIAGYRNPEGTAATIVADAMRRDAAAGGEGLGQYAQRYAVNQGQPVVNADMGGEATKSLARTAANMSDDARRTLNTVASDRFETQGPRISDFLNQMGGGNSVRTLDELKDQASKTLKPLYARAYAEGDRPIWTPELERLSGSPDVLSAMKAAAQTGKSRAITDGFGAFNPGVKVSDDGIVTFMQGKNGAPSYPNLQYWDYVKRELDDAAGAALRAGRNEEAGRLSSQAKMLRGALDKEVPSYGDARGVAATAFGAEDALDAGAKFAAATGKNQEYAKTLSEMSGPEKKLFTHGFLSALQSKIAEGGDRRDVINRIAGSPAARQRIEMVVGQGNYARVEMFLRAESIMDQLRKAVQGNSTTARQLADMAAIPGLIGAGTYAGGGDVKEAGLAAAAAGALKHGSAKINTNVMRHVGDLLASNDTAKIDKALTMIKASKPLQETLRPFSPVLSQALLANDAARRKNAYTAPAPVGAQ